MKLIEDKKDAYVLGGCMFFAFTASELGIPFGYMLIGALIIGIAAVYIVKDPKG